MKGRCSRCGRLGVEINFCAGSPAAAICLACFQQILAGKPRPDRTGPPSVTSQATAAPVETLPPLEGEEVPF
jgi:hypothetical protein